MTKYVLKRLLYMVIVFLLVSLLMYSIYNLIPTDPARAQLEPMKTSLKPAEYEQRYQMLRQQMGLDDPLIVRYLRWIGFWPDVNGKLDGMLQGNFGYSQIYKTDVANVLRATADAPDALAWYWLNRTVQGLDIDPAEMAALVEEVSRTDVTDIAAGVVCDCVYLLKGTEGPADDE